MIRSNKCRICFGKHVRTINTLLRDGRNPSDIAAEFKLKIGTVERHLDNCDITVGDMSKLKEAYKAELGRPMPNGVRIPSAIEANRIDLNVSTLSENIKVLYTSCLEVIKEAEESRKHKLRLMAIREARSILEMVMKASSMLLERSGDRDWQVVLTIILKTLEPFPEAKKAVAKALDEHKQ